MSAKKRFISKITSKELFLLALVVAFVLAFSPIASAEFVKGFDKNLELYPNWIGVDEQGLPTTMPVFEYSSYVSEEVWVEVPCDTDRDGIRDRVSVWIRRPVTKEGFLCPVVMELSPYHEGTVGWSRVSGGAMNSSTDPHVKDMQATLRYHDNYPITPAINPDTTNLTYDDVKFKGTNAWEPIWWESNLPFTVNSWYTGTIPGQVPAATVPSAVGTASPVGTGEGLNWTYSYSPPARHQQYFIRGYATLYGQVIGSRSCTGISNLRSAEEWLCGAAIIKWLNGEANAFATRNGDVQVICDWANGNVAIDGVSYPGSTPTVTAMTGVKGLKVIMPEANTTNQFDYYRSGGGVSSPGGYGGEDINLHASYNFSRFNSDINTSGSIPLAAGPNFDLAAQKVYVETQKHMMEGQDRVSGDYNVEWDLRNQTRGFGHINSDVAVLQTNGLIDWNIKPKSAYLMLQGMRDRMQGTHKMITGLSSHTTQGGRLVPGKDGVERGMLKWYLMFMDHFMLGLDNHADELMYDLNIANNITGVMEGFDYDTKVEERGTIVPGAKYQKIYLKPGPEGKTGRLSYNPSVTGVEHFADMDIHAQLESPTPLGTTALTATNRTTIPTSSNGNSTVNSTQAAFCEDRYIGINRATALLEEGMTLLDYVDKPVEGRLMYISEPLTERVRLSGTPVVHLQAASDKGVGTISAALLEIGRKPRIDTSRTAGSAQTTGSTTVFPAANGVSASSATRYANPVYAATNLSNYKWVTWGHTDVQNPSYDSKAWFQVPEQNYVPNHYFQTTKIAPDQYYNYTVELIPFDYTFEVGTRIAIMVYSTDPNYSPLLTPGYTPEFDIRLGDGSYIDLPLIGQVPTTHTVNFIWTDGHTVLGTLYVGDGGYLDLEAIPEISPDKNKKILSWLRQESGNPFNPGAQIYQDYNLMPWEMEDYIMEPIPDLTHTVEFLWTDGHTVLASLQINDGDYIDPADVPLFNEAGNKKILSWLLQESGTPFDLGIHIHQDYRLMPWVVEDYIEEPDPQQVNVTPSAFVTKLNGNKNDLTITVTEEYPDGSQAVFTETFSINNNAAGTYTVGPYRVYVNTKGNVQIRDCYIVE